MKIIKPLNLIPALIISASLGFAGCGGKSGVEVFDLNPPSEGNKPPSTENPVAPVYGSDSVASYITLHGSNLKWKKESSERALNILKPASEKKLMNLLATPMAANGVRVILPWSELQPQEGGEFDQQKSDFYRDLIGGVEASGMDPMIALGEAPAWLKNQLNSGIDIDVVKGHIDGYINWISRQIVDPQNESIRFVQLWDERNLDPDFYTNYGAEVLAYMGSQVRSVWPTAQTILSVSTEDSNWLVSAGSLVGNLEVGAVVDVIGIKHYPGDDYKSLYTDRNPWSPLAQLVAEINDPASSLFGKKGAVVETGFSSYAPGHGLIAQSIWIDKSLGKMADEIRQSMNGESKIVAWNWNQFTDNGWSDLIEKGVKESHYGVTFNNVGRFAKKPAYRALGKKMAEIGSIPFDPADIDTESNGFDLFGGDLGKGLLGGGNGQRRFT